MSLNPYHIDDQEPTLRQSVYVYMDILGYKDMVRRLMTLEEQEKMLRKLHRALEYARRTYLEQRPEDDLFVKLNDKQGYALNAFTDHIVLSWPICKDPKWEFEGAFRCLKHFQLQMVIEGFFIRGAISFGNVYVDEITVFGSPVLEAYEGESSLARDPRIILTQSAINEVLEHRDHWGNKMYTEDILRDSEGQFFLNYLDSVMIAKDEYGPIYEDVLKHKAIVEKNLDEYKGNPSVWSKYAWVAGYHNDFCDQHPDEFTDEHKINMELFRITPVRIDD